MIFLGVFIYIQAQQTFIIKHAFLKEETDLVSTCDEIVCISLNKHKMWQDMTDLTASKCTWIYMGLFSSMADSMIAFLTNTGNYIYLQSVVLPASLPKNICLHVESNAQKNVDNDTTVNA